jgi:Flp pilus assembly protein TadG
MSTPRYLRSAMALLARFGRDKRANIAVIFGIAVIPIIMTVGVAVDYSEATRIKAKLQSAADAASVASISQNSAGYKAAALMTSNGSVAAGVAEATNIFNGNLATIPGYSGLNVSLTPVPTVTKTATTLTSIITYTAQVPVTFLKAVAMVSGMGNWQYMTITGTSKASSSLPSYLDFYLTLDVSGSMGLPSTTAEAARMQSINPDNWVQYRTGCTLACHFAPLNSACKDPPVTSPAAPPANPATNANYSQQYNTNNACMGYAYSRVSQSLLSALINQATNSTYPKQVPGLPKQMLSGLPLSLNSDAKFGLAAQSSCPTPGTDACIQLRLDAVGYAVTQLFTKASDPTVEKVANQFRIGLYPFIRYLDPNYSPLTANITGSAITNAASNLASLLDTNTNAALGSGGTHIDNALSSVNGLITSVGDGSALNNTKPYVFLVTDGAQDNQVKGVPNGGWSGSNHATTIDPVAVCKPLKDRGIIISVLYIPYQTISPVNTTFAGDEDDYANNNIPNIPASLQGCSSPPDAAGSYFYTANTPDDINNSLKAMFNHAIQTAHITN